MPTDPTKARYYRKQVPLFRLVEKLKLWPSRRGILHGIKEFEERGSYAVVITHCNKRMVVHDSKTSRAARWLRNKWYAEACPHCRIPSGSCRSTRRRSSSGATGRICGTSDSVRRRSF
jgi:pyrrolysyl-tRNA synthetase-like protein